MWGQIGLVVLVLFSAWWIWNYYHAIPQAFSKENFSKSFLTMGILALFLIVFIILCVIILRLKLL